MLFGGRPKLSIGMITGRPASIDNQYVPGSGVGASSISARRSKSRLSRPPHISNNGVANPPTNITAEFIEGEIVVSWTAPTYIGDSNIISYTVTSSPGEKNIITTETSATFTNLIQDTVYTFTVLAKNSGGNSKSSDKSNSVSMSSNATAPTNLSGTISDSSVTITFTNSAGVNGKAITGYEYSIDDGTTYTSFSPSVISNITSSLTITGLTNGTTYNIKLRAVTSTGSGLSASITKTPYSTPSAPTSLSATPGNGQAILSFTQGSTGGSAITNYKYSTDGTNYTALNSTTSPITITGLTNGTAYTIRLKAVNAVGAGTPSDPITVTPYTTPSEPTISSTTSGNGQVTIVFTQGSTGGSAITNYKYSIDNGANYTTFSPAVTTTPITITGLTNGTPYTIRLKAVNVAGTGTASGSITVTPYTTPGVPTISSATEGNGQTILTFTSPTSTGGSAITTYNYTLTSVGNSDITGTTTSSPVTISGLTNGTTYTISLKAVNAAGAGESSTTTSVTPYTIASAPTIGTTTIGNGQATLTFTAPTSTGGKTITKYQYSTDGGSNYTDLSSTATSFTVTGLTNGTSYTIKLRAYTSAGSGTELTTTVTPYTTPGAPSFTAVGGNTNAVITITAPDNGGSTITKYQYMITGTGFTGTGSSDYADKTSTTFTIPELTNGTTYTITLRAVNAAGASSTTTTTVIPYTVPFAPLSLVATAGNGQATIAFTTPTSDGGKSITNYQYSTDGGSTYTAFSPAVTTTPVIITGLTNGTQYTIKLRAINIGGAGVASDSVTVTPIQYLTAGSLLFNSSNEYLKLSPGIALGSGAYTVECWFYNNNAWNNTSPNYSALMGCVINSETNGMNLEFTNSKTVLIDRNGPGQRYTYGFASDITLNTWHHFVLVRNSSLIETIFIDGVKATTTSGGSNSSGGQQTNTLDYSGHSDTIGKTYEGQWYGYLTNFRAVSGSAVYDPTASSITVPTAVLTSITNTKYLMLGDSATSDAAGVQTVTMTGTVTQTTDYKPF